MLYLCVLGYAQFGTTNIMQEHNRLFYLSGQQNW